MIGVAPYQSRPYSDTKTLCDYLLACMQADDDVDVDIYMKHLAILVCYQIHTTNLLLGKNFCTLEEVCEGELSTIAYLLQQL